MQTYLSNESAQRHPQINQESGILLQMQILKNRKKKALGSEGSKQIYYNATIAKSTALCYKYTYIEINKLGYKN